MNPMQHELLVNQAAEGLAPEQFAEFRLLARELAAHEKRWGLFLLKYVHTRERQVVGNAINKLVPRHVDLVVSAEQHPDWPSLEAAICQAAETADVVQLLGLDAWLDTGVDRVLAEKRLRAWNIRREGFAENVAVPVICWLRPATLKSLAETAPDLWSWRAAVHDFALPPAARMAEAMIPFTDEIDNRSLAQRTLRLREIQQYLAEHPAQNKEELRLAALLFIEMAEIQTKIGELDEALHLYRKKALPIFEQLGDENDLAITKTRVVNIHIRRNNLKEALRITQEEILPIFAKTGNKRGIAGTSGTIADIMHANGDLNESLEILQEKVLPIFNGLGDAEACAFTKTRIADILSELGQFDAALHINRNEVLPFFERIGDVLESAITQGKIAHIIQKRGETNEALRIYQDILPIFEKQGISQAYATTLTNIALILKSRGEYPEALRILSEETLPVFERLGDKNISAKIKDQISGLVLQQSTAPSENR